MKSTTNVRIFFLLTNVTRPAGGHAVIYRHVRLLSSHGYRASIVLTKTGQPNFYQSEYSSLTFTDISIAFSESRAIFVLPEADMSIWSKRLIEKLSSSNNIKVLIFNQNHYYTFSYGADFDSESLFFLADHLCSSLSIFHFLRRVAGLKHVAHVQLGIDTQLFRPRLKQLEIAFMGRKMEKECLFVQKAFKLLAPHHDDVSWKLIDNQSQLEVALALGKADIFLSFQRLEGFGLPALEALASGCIVIGFTGGGGDEYASDDNGFWISEGDLLGMIEKLDEVCWLLKYGTEVIRSVRRKGRESATRYSLENETASVLEFWCKYSERLC